MAEVELWKVTLPWSSTLISVSHLTCFEPRREAVVGSCESRENSSLGDGDDNGFLSSFETVYTR